MIISWLCLFINQKCFFGQIKTSYSYFKCKDTYYWQYIKIIADNWMFNCLIFRKFCRITLFYYFPILSAIQAVIVWACHF